MEEHKRTFSGDEAMPTLKQSAGNSPCSESEEHAGVGNEEKWSSACYVDKERGADSNDKIEKLEASIDDCLCFRFCDTNSSKDLVDVIRG